MDLVLRGNILMFIFGLCLMQIPLMSAPLALMEKSDRTFNICIVVYEIMVVIFCSCAFYYFQFVK